MAFQQIIPFFRLLIHTIIRNQWQIKPTLRKITAAASVIAIKINFVLKKSAFPICRKQRGRFENSNFDPNGRKSLSRSLCCQIVKTIFFSNLGRFSPLIELQATFCHQKQSNIFNKTSDVKALSDVRIHKHVFQEKENHGFLHKSLLLICVEQYRKIASIFTSR